MTVKIRTKILQDSYADGSRTPEYIRIPRIRRSHCDMAAFRVSPRFGAIANSDLFEGAVDRAINQALRSKGVRNRVELQDLPECATIDRSGYLATVTVHLA